MVWGSACVVPNDSQEWWKQENYSPYLILIDDYWTICDAGDEKCEKIIKDLLFKELRDVRICGIYCGPNCRDEIPIVFVDGC